MVHGKNNQLFKFFALNLFKKLLNVNSWRSYIVFRLYIFSTFFFEMNTAK